MRCVWSVRIKFFTPADGCSILPGDQGMQHSFLIVLMFPNALVGLVTYAHEYLAFFSRSAHPFIIFSRKHPISFCIISQLSVLQLAVVPWIVTIPFMVVGFVVTAKDYNMVTRASPLYCSMKLDSL
jgi:hypothetical protein